MSSQLSREIIDRSSRNPLPVSVEISGLGLSARAYALAQTLLSSESKFFVICPDDDHAALLQQDIRTFLRLLGRDALTAAVDLLPGWELSPYRELNPSIKARVGRLRALSRIARKDPRIVLCGVKAFAQRCPSPDSLSKRSFELKSSDIISRDELSAKLLAAGYVPSEPVEDPGTFSVRGGIIDIYSPYYRRPFRLDFFDDMIESIRFYDSTTQRAEPHGVAAALVIPVTDFTFDAASSTLAKRAVKTHCDTHGIAKQARDAVAEKLDNNILDPLFEYLGPSFSDEPWTTPADHLETAGEWRMVVSDLLGVENHFDRLMAELKEGFAAASREQRIALPPEALFMRAAEFVPLLKNKISLRLDEIALGVPEQSHETEDGEESEAKHDFSPRLTVRTHRNTDLKSTESSKTLDLLLEKSVTWRRRGYTQIVVATSMSQTERLSFLLNQREAKCRTTTTVDWKDTETIQIVEGSLSSGFRMALDRVAFITDAEIFGPKKQRATRDNRKSQEHPSVAMGSFIPSLEDLNTDEFVVHHTHGIGRFKGLVKLEVDKIPQDFLLLEYAGGDKLYLPVYRLDLVQKYVGEGVQATLDKLGSSNFEKAKSKVKAELQELAHQLLQLYAQRASRHGFSYSAPDELYQEFEAKFPYVETPDQLKAIEDVASDMSADKIMDRLVCGDVGYGKTEVAMRAAYRAVLDGKQVAVLVPTTVLAFQHERSFRERFKDISTPVNIEMVSRFKTSKEVKDVLARTKDGKVDILIGTHRILSKDVAFKDLGLIIVDEEQRFGVEHKERLKALKVSTDVLTLTATPIPRTLHLSLMGLRDISVINTAPIDRLSIRTYVAKYNEEVIASAIRQELSRGGQVFFIHNRVQSINAMADRLHAIVPDAKIIVAHGQLDEKDLEERMLEFYNKKGNVLLCSTIIESGLDIPSANTMIINRADMFGLSQLYQLRGRVGRSQARAYCYLLLPEEVGISEDAKKRLEIIQKFVDLGSGFKIASHDLELRGGGDILGKSQSGHIAAVGYELYTELLEETICEIKGLESQSHFDPEIKLPVPALLPESYVADVHQRLGLYKRASQTQGADALHEIELELKDRFGPLPVEAQNLLWLIRIKQRLRTLRVKALVAGPERFSLEIGPEAKIGSTKVLELLKKDKALSVTQDSRLIAKKPFGSVQSLFQEVDRILALVADT